MARMAYRWREMRWLHLGGNPDREVFGYWSEGLPTFPFGWAPEGLKTKRQLNAMGLCPGGRKHVARLEWDNGRQFARLFDVDHAKPKPTRSTAQHASLEKANTARRTCQTCGRDAGYVLPTKTRECMWCWYADDPELIDGYHDADEPADYFDITPVRRARAAGLIDTDSYEGSDWLEAA